MMFRGREQSHREIGYATFRAIIEELGQRVKIERPPSMEGRHMVMILSALKGALDDLDAIKVRAPTAPPATPAPIVAPVVPPPAPVEVPNSPSPA